MGTDAIAVYLEQINRAVARGDATEHTHRPALKGLIEALGETMRIMGEIDEAIDGLGGWPIDK